MHANAHARTRTRTTDTYLQPDHNAADDGEDEG